MSELTIPHRFRGPDSSGNGGWTAGALASRLWPAVTSDADPGPAADAAVQVTLRKPPPLETPMAVEVDPAAGRATLTTGPDAVLVAEAAVVAEAPALIAPTAPVDAATAREAREGYPGLRSHPFPGCFACGTDRAEGDGLRIFPGPVTDGSRTLVASTWTPQPDLAEGADGLVPLPVTWAALDCVGGWAGDLTDRMMVLGQMTARVLRRPRPGEEHVVVGARLGAEGRRTFTAATLYAADGEPVACAEHVWVAVDPGTFR